MPRAIFVIAATLLALTSCRRRGPPVPHERLDPTASALHSQFDSDVGTVRILMLLSPTDQESLRGVAEIDHRVFEVTHPGDLRAYLVWGPELDAEESDVTDATRSFTDSRGTHYWDYSGRLLDTYAATLHLTEPARDVFLLFGPKARWGLEGLPKPDLWMHLAGAEGRERSFDAAVFAEEALARLPSRARPETP